MTDQREPMSDERLNELANKTWHLSRDRSCQVIEAAVMLVECVAEIRRLRDENTDLLRHINVVASKL